MCMCAHAIADWSVGWVGWVGWVARNMWPRYPSIIILINTPNSRLPSGRPPRSLKSFIQNGLKMAPLRSALGAATSIRYLSCARIAWPNISRRRLMCMHMHIFSSAMFYDRNTRTAFRIHEITRSRHSKYAGNAFRVQLKPHTPIRIRHYHQSDLRSALGNSNKMDWRLS